LHATTHVSQSIHNAHPISPTTTEHTHIHTHTYLHSHTRTLIPSLPLSLSPPGERRNRGSKSKFPKHRREALRVCRSPAHLQQVPHALPDDAMCIKIILCFLGNLSS
jgi:hypothetical protein